MLFQSKALGLEIYQDGFSLVMASGSHDDPVVDRYECRSFAEDIIKPGMKEKNVLHPELLINTLSESYLKLLTRVKRVSLSIPDLAGRVMLMDMDSPIKSKEEGVDQVKWKLKKSFPVDPNDLQLDYQVLNVDDEGTSSLLVALIPKGVVTEYEEVILSAGLEPAKIDFASFNLYRVFSSRLEISEQLTLMLSFRGALSLMVFQDGVLDFYRSKYVGTVLNDPARLFREVNSSLLVYSDSRGGWKPPRLFYYSAPEDRPVLRSVINEAIGTDPLLLDTDAVIGSSKQKIDRATLPGVLSALGAASRCLS